jgi:hypothetical protein
MTHPGSDRLIRIVDELVAAYNGRDFTGLRNGSRVLE